MYSYKTGLGQVWVGSKLPPNPANNIIWLRPSDDHRVLWEIRTYNIYKERWEVLTSAALTADGLLILIRDLEKRCKSLEELKVVLYDTIQNLTPEEQKIARQNIGAISLEDLPPQVEVLQEVGSSTTAVMSQNAVTRELFALDTQIDNLQKIVDENSTGLAVEITINDEGIYTVVTPLSTLTEYYQKFLADPSKYVWQLYLKVGDDQLGLVPMFTVFYGGLHIGFYSPDASGGMKKVWLHTNGDIVDSAIVDNYGPTLVEVVQNTGNDLSQVMSQDAVTEELRKKASVESVTESISTHNTSSTSHADIRELLNTCVGLPAYDSSSYKITFTTLAGTSVEIDLPIEQLALRYNAETESIEFDNADGTTTSIPVSAFVKEYVGSIGDRIQISIDENNVIHATVLKNSIDWDCLSVELQERINDHVTSVDFATKAVRTDIEQTLSIEAQNQALENIGADLMVIDLVNGQAVLTEEQEARLLSCKGVILRGTVNAGKEVLTKIYFSDYQGGDTVNFFAIRNNEFCLRCSYTKSTKIFRFIDDVRWTNPAYVSVYSPQNFSMSQQSQAFANLGMKVYVTDSSFLGSTLSAEEIEQVAASKVLLFTDTGDLFLFGSQDSNGVSFYQFSTFVYVKEIRISKLSGFVSGPGSYAYMDKNALHFTVQKPALTSAQQSQVFENLGWKVHVISESVIGSSDAVSDDEKATRLSATALLVQETGLLYNFSISSGGSRRFYGQFSNSFCTALNVNEATGVITSSFAYLYDPSAVSFDRDQRNVSDDNKNKALGNIGIDFVRIPYSLLGTKLSDEMFAVVDNARGIILVDTPSDYRNPTVFIKGNNVSGSCIFVSFVTGNTYSIFTLNKSTKLLSVISSNLTYGDSVRYSEEQSLTTAQQERALDNIGFPLVHLDFALIGTTLDDNTYNAVASAKGIILENVQDGNNAPSLYFVGSSNTVTTIFVSEFNARVWFVLTLSHTSKKLSLISTGYATDVVRYDVSQDLTDAHKQRARSNIDAVGSSGIKGVEIVYSTAPMQQDNILYIELEETT